jgi:hypothetical protein
MPWILTPELAYTIEARRLRLELASRGIEVDQAQARELARASLGPPRRWVEREPVLDQAGHELLERVARERERERGMAQVQDRDPRPELHPETAEDPDPPQRERGLGRGQGGSAAPSSGETPDRDENFDEVAWCLRNVPDPEDEGWTPT